MLRGTHKHSYIGTQTRGLFHVYIPKVYLAGIVVAVDDESLELFVDHVDHGGEGKLPGKGRLGQLAVLVGKDLRHALELLVSEHFKLVVVIVVKDIATKGIEGYAIVLDKPSTVYMYMYVEIQVHVHDIITVLLTDLHKRDAPS